MYTDLKHQHRISSHLKDLGRRDVQTVIDVCKWLETNVDKPRDIDRRVNSKRMGFRLIAAQMLVKAFQGDIAACREVMDRTEGKVADVVIQGSFDDLVKALESGRQRLLASPEQTTIEGTIVDSNSLPQDPHQ